MKPVLVYLTLIFMLFACKRKNKKITYIRKKTNPIIQIQFERTACYGKCPVFKLTLNPNGTADFEGIKYVKFIGKGSAIIPVNVFQNLKQKLDSMDVRNLKSEYSVNVTDNPTGYLSILFEDFSVKNIKDYGLRGTPELKQVYKQLTDLAKQTQWKSIENEK